MPSTIRLPGRFFAVLYFSLIPVFALIYSWMPSEFYHSTIKFEDSYFEDRQALEDALETKIMLDFEERHDGRLAIHDGQRDLHLVGVTVGSLSVDARDLSFVLKVESDLKTMGSNSYNAAPAQTMNVRLEGRAPVQTKQEDGGSLYNFIVNVSDVSRKWSSLEAVALNLKGDERLKVNELFTHNLDFSPAMLEWRLTEKEYRLLQDFINYERGIPSSSTDTLARMTYLSAVTITTLGFGDIVPITSRARLAVALESILGILFIGLFINSVFSKS